MSFQSMFDAGAQGGPQTYANHATVRPVDQVDGHVIATSFRSPAGSGDGRREVNLCRFLDCFDRVADKDSQYTVQLCTDVPLNNDPMTLVGRIGRENAGHSFLVLKKWVRRLSVARCFGFYPRRRPSMWHPTMPVASVIRDNGRHEINAAITMVLTREQFFGLIGHALALAEREYRLLDFNCTDYALSVFNSVQKIPIELEPYTVRFGGGRRPGKKSPALVIPPIRNTPQMLFAALYAMKNAGGRDAANISIDLSPNWLAPLSDGEGPV